ncbi:MAG: SRPBCC family protein [Chitinophagaceae bacterium]|nr:SRPBCC family protein [Chitinophagaceae bacterium]
MTKAIIITAVALGVIAVTGVILSLAAPKRISVISSVWVHAPKEEVYNQLRFMKNFPSWSPFRLQDPQQKFSVSGKDGEAGATYSWEGVKEKSKGSQTVTSLTDNNKVIIHCDITEPFTAKPVFDYTLTEKNGGVQVQQQFDVDMPAPSNVFALLLGLKKKMAATNQQGLELLKKVSEQAALVSTAK